MNHEVVLYIAEQNKNRKLWDEHDTAEGIAGFIVEEFTEYTQQKDECYVTDDLTALALEIGDVLFLCDRYRLKFGDLPHRLKAIERAVLADTEELGLDPDDCKMAKVIRNSMKYPDHVMSNGRVFQEAAQVCKFAWKAMGGDMAWSHVWVDYLAHVEDSLEDDRTAVNG